MPCVPIAGLTLDQKSQDALRRIREKKNISKVFGSVLTVGVFNSIFTKNKPAVAAFNVTQTDWEIYSKAMMALPIIEKRLIKKEIDLMILHYHMTKYDHKHVQFWRGMKSGYQ